MKLFRCKARDSHSSLSSEMDEMKVGNDEVSQVDEVPRPEMRLLDLYSGCGAMSTGLCLGANMQGINLVTKWAVDINEYACESLKFNHPETKIRWPVQSKQPVRVQEGKFSGSNWRPRLHVSRHRLRVE